MDTYERIPLTHPSDEPEPAGCPMTAALNAIGGKWNLICLFWLESDTRGFNELRRLMPDISHKVLSATLRILEQEELIFRTEVSEVPLRVQYRISAYGESVRPLIQAVRIWGRAHLGRRRLPPAVPTTA